MIDTPSTLRLSPNKLSTEKVLHMSNSLKVYYVDTAHNEICLIRKPNSNDLRDTFFEHLVDTQDLLYYDLDDIRSSDEISESAVSHIKSLRLAKDCELDFNDASNILYNASEGRHLLFVAYDTELSFSEQNYCFDMDKNKLYIDVQADLLNSVHNNNACPYTQPKHSRIYFTARYVPFLN